MRSIRGCLSWMVVLLALAAPGASAGTADGTLARPQGLLWRDSDLPAVFPLQIKSRTGEDYYFRLIDVTTDEAVLAAYVRGGAFFRLLVPPGTFEVRFAAGQEWQGEAALFGPGDATRFFDLPEPLTFGVRDFRTKGGHLIDLSKAGAGEMASVAPLATCQALRLVFERRRDAQHPVRVLRLRYGPDVQGEIREPWWKRDRPRRWRLDVRTAQCPPEAKGRP